jgi:two-component system NtrC family sensor kinase
MKSVRERILVVENDGDISDQIANQTLQPLGFRVKVVEAATIAIQEIARFTPDVVIADLHLPGLSGKDFLVALGSQNLAIPVVVLAQKGMEGDIIQAFRLGAADYLTLPVREAELVSAVERVLRQVRAKREREMLAQQLKQTNDELQRRVRELTTIFAIGKAVTSVTNQASLFEKIVEGAVYVTEADFGWLLVRDEADNKTMRISAQRNLPGWLAAKLGQPWDDGLSSLVALSGEPLTIHGEALKRFKISQLGQAAMIIPLKIKKDVVGLLVMVRKAPLPFSQSNKTLLEAVSDYASISLVNAGLFRALEDRARALQKTAENAQAGERSKDETIQKIRHELGGPLNNASQQIDRLLAIENLPLNAAQKGLLLAAQNEIRRLAETLETLTKSNSKA